MKKTKSMALVIFMMLVLIVSHASFAIATTGTSVGVIFGDGSSEDDDIQNDHETGEDGGAYDDDDWDTGDDDSVSNEDVDDNSDENNENDASANDASADNKKEDSSDDEKDERSRSQSSLRNGKYTIVTEDRKSDGQENDQDDDIKSEEKKKRIEEVIDTPKRSKVDAIMKKVEKEDIEKSKVKENAIYVDTSTKNNIQKLLSSRNGLAPLPVSLTYSDVHALDIDVDSNVQIKRESQVRNVVVNSNKVIVKLENDKKILDDAKIEKDLEIYSVNYKKVSKTVLSTIADEDKEMIEIYEIIPGNSLYGVKFDPVPEIVDMKQKLVKWTFTHVKKGQEFGASYTISNEIGNVSSDTLVIQGETTLMNKILNWFD